MHHITLTGIYAGLPICSGEPGHKCTDDDEYSHLIYGTKEQVENWVERFIDCPHCLNVYHDVYRD